MSNTQALFIAPDAGRTHQVLGMTHFYKVTPAECGGRYLAFEVEIPPGCGAPMHRHEVDSELFHVLAGAVTFVQPDGQRVVGPGSSAFLPVGGEHAFYNGGAVTARALVIASPGVEAERFFAEIDAASRRTTVDLALVSAAAREHGLTILAG
jgi:uncharacterized cupin superfamily protein